MKTPRISKGWACFSCLSCMGCGTVLVGWIGALAGVNCMN